MSTVIVIGGGAAGMLAAIAAAHNKSDNVMLLEKNEKLGKKIYITGKGRCNITNASEIEDILQHITRNYQFMYSSIYGFTNDDIVTLLEENGCPTKVERGNRVFPVSDRSSDVISALQRAMKQLGVKVCLRTKVQELLIQHKEEEMVCAGVMLADGTKQLADKVIVATGGLSYPTTGSTGDGYAFAKQAGHNIVSLRPGLVPFETKELYIKQMQGLSLRNIKFTMFYHGKILFAEQGELLFTHFGISGPLVLSASSYVTDKIDVAQLTCEIDLKPALDEKKLDERILRDFSEAKNKDFKNVLDGLLPKKMIPVVIALSGIPNEKKVHDITKEERMKLVQVMKHLPFSIQGVRGYEEAIITKGGVDVKQIDPATMESKLVKHLHFAGEVLDLDAVTGGYNLQIAWSTGYAAGTGK